MINMQEIKAQKKHYLVWSWIGDPLYKTPNDGTKYLKQVICNITCYEIKIINILNIKYNNFKKIFQFLNFFPIPLEHLINRTI